jgi:putative transposase
MISRTDTAISLRRQCELIGINRSGLYYERQPENIYNLELMNLIDEEFTRHPHMGVPSMTVYLRNLNKKCGPKRIRRLMRRMGLEAIYPKPNTSRSNKQHKIYPYLLENIDITRPNQVWATDITYIRLRHGFAYLVVIMDWYSRSVFS